MVQQQPYFQPLQEGLCTGLTCHEMYQTSLEDQQKETHLLECNLQYPSLLHHLIFLMVILNVWPLKQRREGSSRWAISNLFIENLLIHLGKEHQSTEVLQGNHSSI